MEDVGYKERSIGVNLSAAKREPHKIFRLGVFVLFFASGIGHFLLTEAYLQIMPPYIPAPRLMVQISGVCELAGPIGILIPRFRKAVGYGLLPLLVAVFPANIHMFMQEWMRPDFQIGIYGTLVLLRLPVQAFFMFSVVKAYSDKTSSPLCVAEKHSLPLEAKAEISAVR